MKQRAEEPTSLPKQSAYELQGFGATNNWNSLSTEAFNLQKSE